MNSEEKRTVSEVKAMLADLLVQLNTDPDLRADPHVRRAIAEAAIATYPAQDSVSNENLDHFSRFITLFERDLLNENERSTLLNDLGDYEPIDNERAARDILMLSQMAQDRETDQVEQYYTPWYSFDGLVPHSVGKTYPAFDPESLIIMSWVAKRNKAGVVEIAWLNSALRDYVARRLSKEKEWDNADKVVAAWFRHFATRPLDRTESEAEVREHITRKDVPTISLKFFFSWLSDLEESDSKTAFDEFRNRLIRQAPALLKGPEENPNSYDSLWDKYPKEAKEGNETEDVEAFCRLLQPSPGLGHVVCGARALKPKGVRLRTPTHYPDVKGKAKPDSRIDGDRSFDLYGVWHIREQKRKEKFTDDSFLAVQGILIPVTLRRKKVEELEVSNAQAQATRIVNRNFAHNLGSHALQHIAGEIRQKGQKASEAGSEEVLRPVDDEFQLARFLAYVAERADLLALASMEELPSGMPMPLDLLVQEFSSQGLLLKYLCRTEQSNLSGKPRRVSLKLHERAENPLVSVHGGALGMHAFFALLENFARNSMKHAPRRAPDADGSHNTVRLILNVQQGLDKKIVCQLWDDAADPLSSDARAKLESNQERLVNPPEEQYSAELGLMEMNLWAGYLQGRNFSHVLSTKDPKIRKCMTHEWDNSDRPQTKLVFYFQPARFIQSVRELTTGGTTQFTIDDEKVVRDRSSDEPKDDQPSGVIRSRWFSRTARNSVDSPFGELAGVDADAFFDAVKTDEKKIKDDAESLLKLQHAWIASLRKHSLGGNTEPIRLLILDSSLATNTQLHANATDGHSKRWDYFLDADASISAHVINENACLRGDEFDGLLAVWDRHGSFGSDFVGEGCYAKKTVFYESYTADSQSPTRYLLPSLLSSPELTKQNAILFLIESALTQVHVVDERLCESVGRSAINTSKRAGIFVFNPYEKSANTNQWFDRLDQESSVPNQAVGHMPITMESIHVSLGRNAEAFESELEFLDRFRNRARQIPYAFLHTGKGSTKLDASKGTKNVKGRTRVEIPPLSVTTLGRLGFSTPSKLMLVQWLYQEGLRDVG